VWEAKGKPRKTSLATFEPQEPAVQQ
jgi:hypothetical protein